MVHFALTVQLPFDTKSPSNAPDVVIHPPYRQPWVLVGCSFAGTITAWIKSLTPDTFAAYHASSAPVEAIYDYWAYAVPIEKGIPQNCSKDLALIIDYVDNILSTGSKRQTFDLKALFRLEALNHNDNFGNALESAINL
ncbi:hypothetical protein GQ53DRAFT_216299 [Thozetella sp. PMI_491]|nr:hypothetical protein GQ53DRAFT_216299 [Thozetella sp. PMI_491]